MDDFRHPDFMRNHDSSSCTGREKWYSIFYLGRPSEHRQLPACPTRIRVSSIRVRPDTTPMGKTTAPERGARPNGHQRCRLWDAARLAASLLYIKLQGNERFQQQMAKARQEFKEKTSGQTRINAPSTQSTATGQSLVYTLSGQPATSETRGIVIVDHKKVLKH